MLSDWLSYPAYQCVVPVCGATWVIGSPAKSTVTFGPGLRNRSTCMPNGTAVASWPFLRRSHLASGWAPWLLPRSSQNSSSAMSMVHEVNCGSPKSTALMSNRSEPSSSR